MGFVIGLDGGRSKTAGLLCDDAGRVLARARGAGSAVLGQPSAEACQALAGLVGDLCAQGSVRLEAVDAVGIGLSGVDFADEFAGQHAALAAALGVSPPALTLTDLRRWLFEIWLRRRRGSAFWEVKPARARQSAEVVR